MPIIGLTIDLQISEKKEKKRNFKLLNTKGKRSVLIVIIIIIIILMIVMIKFRDNVHLMHFQFSLLIISNLLSLSFFDWRHEMMNDDDIQW